MTPALKRILDSDIGKGALREASFIASAERAAGQSKWLGPVDEQLTQAAREAAAVGKMAPIGRPGVAKGLSLETLDYLKRGFDAMLDKPAYRNELTGALNKKGWAVNSVARALAKELDRATGGEQSLYKAARAQYAGDAEVVEAIRDGAKFFKQSPEAIADALSNLSEAGKAAYRNGAARAVLDVVENTPDTASVANRLFGKAMTRKKIAAVFPDREGLMDFARKMVAEQRFTKTAQTIGAGSRTAPMLGEMADLQQNVGSLGAVVGAKLPGIHALVGSGLGRRMSQKLFPTPEAMNQALSRMLTTRNRADQLRLLDELAPYMTPRRPIPSGLYPGLLGAVQQEAQMTQGLLGRR